MSAAVAGLSAGLRQLAAPALAAAALALAQSVHHADAVDADSAYLAKLKAVSQVNHDKLAHHAPEAVKTVIATTASAMAPASTSDSHKTRDRQHGPVVDVAAINAAVRTSSELRRASAEAQSTELEQASLAGRPEELACRAAPKSVAGGTADAAHTEAAYLQRLQKDLNVRRPEAKIAPNAVPVEIRSLDDCNTIHREVCIVAITRGSHPALAAALHRTMAATAAADELGFTYYLITDATPSEVVEKLERALHAQIPGTYAQWSSGTASDVINDTGAYSAAELQEGAVPVITLFDRAASTQRKFFCPPVVHPDEVPAPVSASHTPGALVTAISVEKLQESLASEVPMAVQLLLASTPYPSEISAWSTSFAYGELQPTLLGAPRPPGDYVPGHAPYVTQVTSEAWFDVVLDPHSDVLLEAYMSHCPMCMCLAPRLRMLGYLLHKYGPRQTPASGSDKPLVKVAVMNVDENERPTDWMPGPAFPTIQLFAASGPSAAAAAAAGARAGAAGSVSGTGAAPWTKAHGPECGHAAAPALQVLRKYGALGGAAHATPASSSSPAAASTAAAPSPSTVQTSPSTPSRGPNGEGSYLSGILQARLPSLYSSSTGSVGSGQGGVRPATVGEHPRAGNPYAHRLTAKGTPPCVPSVDFTHPTQPNKSALPSVTDLLWWVSAHCSAGAGAGTGSAGFDPATVRVPASELRHSRERMVELGMLPPSSAAASSSSSSSSSVQQEGTVSLLELAADMDAESRAYEGAVFDSFYYTSMLNAYRKACYGEEKGASPAEGEPALPPTFTCPLPQYTAPAARAKLPLFTALLDQLKAVAVEGGTYGRLEETVHALDALAEFAEEHGVKAGARAWLMDQEEGKKVSHAVSLAAQLKVDSAGRGGSSSNGKRMQ